MSDTVGDMVSSPAGVIVIAQKYICCALRRLMIAIPRDTTARAVPCTVIDSNESPARELLMRTFTAHAFPMQCRRGARALARRGKLRLACFHAAARVLHVFGGRNGGLARDLRGCSAHWVGSCS